MKLIANLKKKIFEKMYDYVKFVACSNMEIIYISENFSNSEVFSLHQNLKLNDMKVDLMWLLKRCHQPFLNKSSVLIKNGIWRDFFKS